MLVRIWTTQIASGREPEYLAFANERSREMFLSQPGCLGVLFLKTNHGEHAACSFWSSNVEIGALTSSSSYNATVSDLRATGVLLGEAKATVYDLEGGAIDGSSFITILKKHGVSELRET